MTSPTNPRTEALRANPSSDHLWWWWLTAPAEEKSGEQKAALSRELSEFLFEFSIAVHRFAMYPGDHPSLVPATEKVVGGLSNLLQNRRALSLGIGQRQLVIDNVPTDERHPVLSDLARRLHDHHLSAITFERGASLDELAQLFRALAEEPDRDGRPVGLLPEGERPPWEHVKLYPIGYDQLELGREGKEVSHSRSRRLWLGLAQAALQVAEGKLDPDAPPEARVIAREIVKHGSEEGYDQVVVGFLLQLAAEMKGAQAAEAAELRERMSEFIRELDDTTLDRVMRLGGGRPQTRQFMMDLNRGGLPVDAVTRVVGSVARIEGHPISSSLIRVLTKLAVHAEQGSRNVRAEAASAIRENVEKLITGWDRDDLNPDAYTQVLDRISLAAPAFEPDDGEEGDELSGSERIVQMALEVDAYGPTLTKAVSELLDAGEITRLLSILDDAPEGSEVADRLCREVTTPTQLKRILAGEDVDEEGLRLLTGRIGAVAIDPLIEHLISSESSAVRRKIFACLSGMGDAVGEKAMECLRDERWFVQRTMLLLLQKVETLPEGFSAQHYIQHADPRIRREAFPLAIRNPQTRKRALAAALADRDERIVRLALLELQDEIPETMVPVVVKRVLQADAFPQLRSLAARTLKGAKSQLALDALLSLCAGEKTIFGRPKLPAKSPELLAALWVLASEWGDDPGSQATLKLARESDDLQIRAAAASRSDP